jgi:hypothetical protein
MKKILYILIALMVIPAIVSAETSSMSTVDGTDWTLWILSGIIGLFLFLMSLNVPTSQPEAEIDAILSIMSWIPIGFCMWGSFNLDRMVSPGVVIIYSLPFIGIMMGCFLGLSVFNTLRIISLFKIFRQQAQEAAVAKQMERFQNDKGDGLHHSDQ